MLGPQRKMTDRRPHRILLEVGVTDVDGARLAEQAKADRLELCSGLEVGGLTPSPGCFLEVRESVQIPIYVLLRPLQRRVHLLRSAIQNDATRCAMVHEARANGIVFGIVQNHNGLNRVDADRCRVLVEQVGGKAVFHRAFDFIADPLSALEELGEIGFERIQTSGGCSSAVEGIDKIAAWIAHPGCKVEILPAGGIRPETVGKLLVETHADQVHASLRAPIDDPSLGANRAIAKGMGALDPDAGWQTTSGELIQAMRKALDLFQVDRHPN